MKNKDKVRAGKAGARQTHRKRYEALVELSKHVSKKTLDWYRTDWETKKLLQLLEAYQKNGRTN